MQAPTVEIPQIPQPPAIPATPPVTVTIPQTVGAPRPSSSPHAVFEAVQAKREILGEYMNRLLNRRNNVSERLNQPNITSAEKQALEEHLQELNTRIIDMEKQLHQADAEVAAAAGVPGATVEDSRDSRSDGPPDEMLIVGTVFVGISLVILAISWARRLWRGAAKVVMQVPAALEARLTRFEQSLDAVAIEIERVSEGQRFLTKVLVEDNPRGIGAGPAQPIETRSPVAEPIRRG
jgi:hypothetical protein